MEITIYLLSGLVLLLVWIMAAPVEFSVRYGREGEDDVLALVLLLWPGIRFRYRAVVIDFKTSLAKSNIIFHGARNLEETSGKEHKYTGPGIAPAIKQTSFLLDIYRVVRPPLMYLKERLCVKELEWQTRFGLNDPLYTGLATGIIWSVKEYLALIICSRIRVLKTPVICVSPDFSNAGLAVRINLKISSRTGYVILTGLLITVRLLFSGKVRSIFKMLRKGRS